MMQQCQRRDLEAALESASAGECLSSRQALSLSDCTDMPALLTVAARMRDIGHGNISYNFV